MLILDNVTKKYGKFTAVDNISLEIKEGQIFGFVGPNGAGKTTTLKMIATLLRPTSGSIYIGDIEVINNVKQVRSIMGYMPDFFGVYDNLKVDEYLEFYSDVAGIDYREAKTVISDLLDLVDLKNKRNEYVDSLSRGMKQRLCLARSLVHNPKLLILDEPASGMDPRARVQMKRILKELGRMGKTILISSHILPELSELCTNIGIIEKGKIVENGTVNEIMRKSMGSNNIKLRVMDFTEKTVKLLQEEPIITHVYGEGHKIEFSFQGDDHDMVRILRRLINSDIPIISFSPMESNLEEIFMKVTKGDEQ